MRVYIDLENLISLLESKGDKQWGDCMRMLEKQCDVKFNFKKSEISALETSDKDAYKTWTETFGGWIKKLTEGGSANEERLQFRESHPFPQRNSLQKSIYAPEDNADLRAVYLLNDECTKYLQKEGCLLVSPVGEEITTLASLNMDNNDLGYDKDLNIQKLHGWEDIKQYLSPCTDIIIADRYVLKYKNSLQQNIYALISLLSSHAKNKKLNICFIIERTYEDYTDIISEIKQIVKKRTKAEPNVTIIKVDNKMEHRKHDRLIFTNYKSIDSRDTFLFFNEKSEVISHGDFLTIHSFAHKKKEEIYAQNFISSLQDLINEITKKCPNTIIGDKISNFLSFNQ